MDIGGCDGQRRANENAPPGRALPPAGDGERMAEHKVLRDQSRAFLERAKQEADPKLKQLLARHATALVQLAEKLEQQSSD